MALDGAFLHHLKKEIEERAIGLKVDKIYMPTKDEIVLTLRGFSGSCKLLLSAKADTTRICFIDSAPENPKQPPMLCMLLRKKLLGMKLIKAEQPGLERVLLLSFEGANELGDITVCKLVIEIMGRYSNVILLDSENKIIDALKRVDAEMSAERMVFPGLMYRLPPSQDKLCLLDKTAEEIIRKMRDLPRDMMLSKALLSVLQGVSPIICREFEFYVSHGKGMAVSELISEDRAVFFLNNLKKTVEGINGKPVMVGNPGEKPIDFTFIDINQYGASVITKTDPDFSSLLENFYGERDRIDRMKARSRDLLKLLSNAADRLSRKINLQRAELEACENREYLRLCGDLITANQYLIEKGASSAELANYYEEGAPLISVALNPALSPLSNAQKYYKEYKKSKTAEEKLCEQIENAEKELEYIDSVFEELADAQTEVDLKEIRDELKNEGYIRRDKNDIRKKETKVSLPLETSCDGFRILIGRNNRQNDLLTLKMANKNDYWFHTRNMPGSHVILVTDNKEPTDKAMEEAARQAALHSRGKNSSQIPVDYTRVRHVSKPSGAKPGKVIYKNFSTVIINL